MRAKSVMYIDHIYRGAIEEKQLDRKGYILLLYEKNMSELKYTEKLMDSDTVFKVGDNPAGVDGQAFDTEIEHYLGGLMESIESHWGVHLHGDDRGAIAWEAVAKWVVESLEDAEKEVE